MSGGVGPGPLGSEGVGDECPGAVREGPECPVVEWPEPAATPGSAPVAPTGSGSVARPVARAVPVLLAPPPCAPTSAQLGAYPAALDGAARAAQLPGT